MEGAMEVNEKLLRQAQTLYDALKRITKYQSPEQLLRNGEKNWGCSGEEALQYAYENIQGEARAAIRGMRRPEAKKTKAAKGV